MQVDLLVLPIIEVVHFEVESDLVINMIIYLLLVLRHQGIVIKRIELLNFLRCRLLSSIVVYKPAGHIRVESIRNGVEKILVAIISTKRFGKA